MSFQRREERSSIALVETVLEHIHNALQAIKRSLDDEQPTEEVIYTSEQYLRSITENLTRLKPVLNEEIYHTHEADVNLIRNKLDNLKSEILTAPVTDNKIGRRENRGKKGNSFRNIDKDCLKELLSLGFSVRKIAKDDLLGGELHYNTIHKFIQLNKIKTPRERYSLISDAELNEKLERLTERFPNSGVQENICVQRIHHVLFNKLAFVNFYQVLILLVLQGDGRRLFLEEHTTFQLRTLFGILILTML